MASSAIAASMVMVGVSVTEADCVTILVLTSPFLMRYMVMKQQNWRDFLYLIRPGGGA